MNNNLSFTFPYLPAEIQQLLAHEAEKDWFTALDRAQQNDPFHQGEYLTTLFHCMITANVNQEAVAALSTILQKKATANQLSPAAKAFYNDITDQVFKSNIPTNKRNSIDMEDSLSSENRSKKQKQSLHPRMIAMQRTTGLPDELAALVQSYTTSEPLPGNEAIFSIKVDNSAVTVTPSQVMTRPIFELKSDSPSSTITGVKISYAKDIQHNDLPVKYILHVYFNSKVAGVNEKSITNYIHRNSINPTDIYLSAPNFMSSTKKQAVIHTIDLIAQDNKFANEEILKKLYPLLERFGD